MGGKGTCSIKLYHSPSYPVILSFSILGRATRTSDSASTRQKSTAISDVFGAAQLTVPVPRHLTLRYQNEISPPKGALVSLAIVTPTRCHTKASTTSTTHPATVDLMSDFFLCIAPPRTDPSRINHQSKLRTSCALLSAWEMRTSEPSTEKR